MHVMVIGEIDWYICAYRYCDRRTVQKTATDKNMGRKRGPKHRYCLPEDGRKESRCARKERYYRAKDSEIALRFWKRRQGIL